MNLSKESCHLAQKIARQMAEDASKYQYAKTDLSEVSFITEFLVRLEGKLPTEATIGKQAKAKKEKSERLEASN